MRLLVCVLLAATAGPATAGPGRDGGTGVAKASVRIFADSAAGPIKELNGGNLAPPLMDEEMPGCDIRESFSRLNIPITRLHDAPLENAGMAGGRHPPDIRQLPCRRERPAQLLFRPDRRLYPQLRRKRHAGILPPRHVDRAQPQQVFHRPALRRGQMDRRRVERHPPLYGREMERIPLRHRVLGNLERARSGPENVDGNARSVQRLLRYGGPGAEKAVPAPGSSAGRVIALSERRR